MNDERALSAIKPHLKPGEHVTWCWRGCRTGLNTTYAVTNQAAIIVEDVWPRSVRRFTPQAVAARVCFGDRMSLVSDAGDGSRFDSTMSFIGVRDLATAESALLQLATTHKD